MSLKPWREVIVPHPDVLNGTFQQSEFAADLSAVRTGPEFVNDFETPECINLVCNRVVF